MRPDAQRVRFVPHVDAFGANWDAGRCARALGEAVRDFWGGFLGMVYIILADGLAQKLGGCRAGWGDGAKKVGWILRVVFF